MNAVLLHAIRSTFFYGCTILEILLLGAALFQSHTSVLMLPLSSHPAWQGWKPPQRSPAKRGWVCALLPPEVGAPPNVTPSSSTQQDRYVLELIPTAHSA